jgi:hypothetical protein
MVLLKDVRKILLGLKLASNKRGIGYPVNAEPIASWLESINSRIDEEAVW